MLASDWIKSSLVNYVENEFLQNYYKLCASSNIIIEFKTLF